jgi:hypothetical protein
VIDTSILLIWLGVPGKDTCTIKGEKWEKSYE